MYVVRRAFRHLNQMVTPGSVVEPGSIKNFKGRLRDRFIVEVTEQDFDQWNEYFKTKYGTPIKLSEPVGQNDAGQNDAGQNDAQAPATGGVPTEPVDLTAAPVKLAAPVKPAVVVAAKTK